MPSFHVPTEIVLYILRFVAATNQLGRHSVKPVDARRTMSSCALVSRTWRALAQPLQWRDLSLHFLSDGGDEVSDDEDDDLCFREWIRATKTTYTCTVTKADVVDFLKGHGHLAHHVRSLTLAPIDIVDKYEVLGSMRPQELLDIMREMPRLRDLHLSRIWLDLDPPPSIDRYGRGYDGPGFPALEQLSVDLDTDAACLSPRNMLAVLNVFTDVKQVVLQRSLADAPDSTDRWPIRCRTESLVVQDTALSVVLRSLSSSPAVVASRLQMLHLGRITPSSWPDLQTIMVQASPTLKRLSLCVDTANYRPQACESHFFP